MILTSRYPGCGSFYVEHLDNPRYFDPSKDNGRRLTVLCVQIATQCLATNVVWCVFSAKLLFPLEPDRCYLNDEWDASKGGALRLDGARRRRTSLANDTEPHSSNSSGAVEILPIFNRVATFWADEMPHEVLPAWQKRCALTVWLNRGTPTETSATARTVPGEDLAELMYDQMLQLVSPGPKEY